MCSQYIPSRKLTYPTWGKGTSSSNMPYQGDILIPWRVIFLEQVPCIVAYLCFVSCRAKSAWDVPPTSTIKVAISRLTPCRIIRMSRVYDLCQQASKIEHQFVMTLSTLSSPQAICCELQTLESQLAEAAAGNVWTPSCSWTPIIMHPAGHTISQKFDLNRMF